MSQQKEMRFDFKCISQYTFHINIHKLWNTIKDATRLSILISKLSPKIQAEPVVLSKNYYFEISNQFRVKYDNFLDLFFTISEIIETDYFCKINWLVSYPKIFQSFLYEESKNQDQFKNEKPIHLIIYLHKISHDYTFFISQFEGVNNIFKMRNKIINRNPNNMEIQLYYHAIEKCLEKKYMFQSQIESKIISANFDMTKDYFLNSKVCTGMMGEILSCSDEIIKKGTIVVYRNNLMKKCIIQVRQCMIKNKKTCLIFAIYEGNSCSFPTRELRVELYSVNKNETFVALTHNFLKEITDEEIENLSRGKKKLLKKLGYIIEKSFNNNNNFYNH